MPATSDLEVLETIRPLYPGHAAHHRRLSCLVAIESRCIKLTLGPTDLNDLAQSAVGVVVEVCDQCPGIPRQAMGWAFRKFSTLGNSPTGSENSTGLGLTVCKQLIEAQSGEIGLRNNPGQGVTFFFRLLASHGLGGPDITLPARQGVSLQPCRTGATRAHLAQASCALMNPPYTKPWSAHLMIRITTRGTNTWIGHTSPCWRF